MSTTEQLQPAAGAPDGARETWTEAAPVVSHLPVEEVVALQERSEAPVGEPGAILGATALVINSSYQRTIIPLWSRVQPARRTRG